MNSNLRELTIDQVMIMLNLLPATNEQSKILFKQIVAKGGWCLEAIKKRFEAHILSVDEKTMILIMYLGDGIVGKCAKYVDDIARICSEKKITKLDIKDYTMKIHPDGVPNF